MLEFGESQKINADQGLGLFDLTPETLRESLIRMDEPPYRATQILDWVFGKGADSYEAMSNLPKRLRERLAAELPLFQSKILRRQESSDGTVKLLLAWPDGATSECVMIPEAERRTACLSTQVGCPVQCAFCASGLGGLERDLSAGQIVEQAMRVRAEVGKEGRLSNVVFMGLGEPLANYEATVQAIHAINAAWGMGIGARKITISTVGLPKQMRRLAEERMQITLALSLHAPTDELRRELIPWARGITIDALVDAACYYFQQTGREITLEYILLAGVNDTPRCAAELCAIVRKIRANVNLIPFNPVEGLPFHRPTEQGVLRFLELLRGEGINAHVRWSRGLDIDGACGQLRRRAAAADGVAAAHG
jgi:23S rRNA (adenine2503-C2)-methyltransferase